MPRFDRSGVGWGCKLQRLASIIILHRMASIIIWNTHELCSYILTNDIRTYIEMMYAHTNK